MDCFDNNHWVLTYIRSSTNYYYYRLLNYKINLQWIVWTINKRKKKQKYANRLRNLIDKKFHTLLIKEHAITTRVTFWGDYVLDFPVASTFKQMIIKHGLFFIPCNQWVDRLWRTYTIDPSFSFRIDDSRTTLSHYNHPAINSKGFNLKKLTTINHITPMNRLARNLHGCFATTAYWQHAGCEWT